MSALKIYTDPKATIKFNNFPPSVKPKLDYLRLLILEVATEDNLIDEIQETLKWGEPSYLVHKGSTLRINWTPKKPEQYAMYFKCTSKLVSSFREVYGNLFNYEDNRAIVFNFKDVVPKNELKQCIRVTLNYHRLKNLPNLGL